MHFKLLSSKQVILKPYGEASPPIKCLMTLIFKPTNGNKTCHLEWYRFCSLANDEASEKWHI